MCLLIFVRIFFSPRRILHRMEVALWRWLWYCLNFEPLEMLSSPNLIIKKNNGSALTNDNNFISLDPDLRNTKWNERKKLSSPSWFIAGPKQNLGEQWQQKESLVSSFLHLSSASCSTWALVPGVLSAPLTSLPPHSVTIYFKRVSPGLQRSSVILPPSHSLTRDSLVAQLVKNLPAMQETQGSIPGSGSSSGEGNGNPLQYSCQENPMDRGAWQARVHGIEKSWTQLND